MDMKRTLDIATIVLTALLLLGFAVLSLRGTINPQVASARFGAEVTDAAGALFYRVYLSRNLVIVITGAVLLLMRQWTPLAVLVTVTAAVNVLAASGAKATKIVQLEPAIRLAPQFVLSGKLVLLAPVTAMLVKVIVVEPVLVTVIDLFPLLVPKACLPKSNDVGERVSVGDPVLPHPGTLKLEIRVFQMVEVPVSFAARYSFTYQNAQPPTGSTVMAL